MNSWYDLLLSIDFESKVDGTLFNTSAADFLVFFFWKRGRDGGSKLRRS